MLMRRRPVPRRARARGNALLWALLALAVMGMAALTTLQNKRLDLKRESGHAEAGVMARLRAGAQALVDEQLVSIQRGEALTRNGITLPPVAGADGELLWSPTIEQLRDMGYLPAGWTSTRSPLNDGAYTVSFARTPAGCVGPACDVAGLLVLSAPVRDPGRHTAVDGVVIGPILTRSGADGGVSLASSPNDITGFGGTWRVPNPVPGAPAGVVAMRFGTQAGGLSQFVRIRDTRDPDLAGDLTVQGRGRFASALHASGQLGVGSDADNPCLRVTATGTLSVACDGRATIGATPDTLTEIGPDGIRTARSVEAAGGLRTAQASLFPDTDPTTIAVTGDTLSLRSGTAALATFQDGSVVVPRSMVADRLVLKASVEEGQSCAAQTSSAESGTQYAVTSDGSFAACLQGRWVIASRFAVSGAPCARQGILANSSSSGEALICRSGRYVPVGMLVSNFVLQRTLALNLVAGRATVEKPVCAAEPNVYGEALIIVTPNNEFVSSAFSGTALSGINRFAVDYGGYWEVVVESSADQSGLPSVAVVQLYCFYEVL